TRRRRRRRAHLRIGSRALPACFPRRAPLLSTHNDGGVLGGGNDGGQSEVAARAPHLAAPLTAVGLLPSLTGSGSRQPRPSSRRSTFGRRAPPATAAWWVVRDRIRRPPGIARPVGGLCRHGRRLGRQAARARARRAARPERGAPAPIHNVRGAQVKRRRPFTAPSRECARDGGAAWGAWRRATGPVRPRRWPGPEALMCGGGNTLDPHRRYLEAPVCFLACLLLSPPAARQDVG
ncbi:unnamed protein product, partial [Urochloa humidicola]